MIPSPLYLCYLWEDHLTSAVCVQDAFASRCALETVTENKPCLVGLSQSTAPTVPAAAANLVRQALEAFLFGDCLIAKRRDICGAARSQWQLRLGYCRPAAANVSVAARLTRRSPTRTLTLTH